MMIVASTAGCLVIAPGNVFGRASAYEEVELRAGDSWKKVLVLDIDGEISSGPQSPDTLFGSGDSTVNEVAEKLEKARRDPSVKAVVLRVDSPGGGVTASDVIYKMIKDFKAERKIPVYVSMLDLAASGGYYVSMAADEIYAHPTTITGSIGVIAIFPQFEAAGRKLGIYAEVLKSGPNKDITGGFTNMTDEQRTILQGMVDSMYGRFLQVIEEGRPKLAAEKIRTLADGRIYTAQEAKDAGLIDGVLYLEDVIKLARLKAGSERAQVVLYRKSGTRAIDSVYASSDVPSPRAAAASSQDVNLLKVDANLPTAKLPVFRYLWIP
jgi:protease-4